MPKRLITIVLVSFMSYSVVAHQLPQKLNPQLSNHPVASQQMHFSEQDISHWSQYAETLDVEVIAEQVNMPSIISYHASSQTEANIDVECSIYLNSNSDKLSSLCGDLDDHSIDFMKSARAAIGFCHFRQVQLWSNSGAQNPQKHLVPYFKGPAKFVSSMDEITNGAHHDEYQITQGIQFHCVEAHDSTDVVEPVSNDLDL